MKRENESVPGLRRVIMEVGSCMSASETEYIYSKIAKFYLVHPAGLKPLSDKSIELEFFVVSRVVPI